MKPDRLFAFAFFACALAIAGCGGNSLNPLTPVQQTPGPTLPPAATPTPVVLATQAPYQAQAVQTIATPTPAPAGQTPAPIPVALPTGAPVSGTIKLSSAQSVIPPNTQIAVALQNSAPSGLPSLQSLLRRPEAIRRGNAASNASVISYVSMLFSQSVMTSPSFSFTIPAADVQPNTSYYVAFFNPNTPSLGWQLAFEGPGTLSGTTVTFNGGENVAFEPYVYYWFGLYAVSQAAQTPTPAPSLAPAQAPTAAPSALPAGIVTPAPHLTLSPGELSVYTGFTSLFSASDASYSGAYSVSSTNTAVATVTQTLPGLFTVSGIAAGSAIVTVSEAAGGTSASEFVTVIQSTPTPSPSPAPTPDVKISPTSLNFLSTGSTLPFTASDVNYSGAFTVSSSNASVATVTQTSRGSFAVTSVAAGTATITVRESNGASATCTVTVTTTTIPVN